MLRALCHMCPPEWDMTWEMSQPCTQSSGLCGQRGTWSILYHFGDKCGIPIKKYWIIALVEVTALLCASAVPVSAKPSLIKPSCCTYSFFWEIYIYICPEKDIYPYISINTRGCGARPWAGALSNSSGVAGRQPGSKWVPVSCASSELILLEKAVLGSGWAQENAFELLGNIDLSWCILFICLKHS